MPLGTFRAERFRCLSTVELELDPESQSVRRPQCFRQDQLAGSGFFPESRTLFPQPAARRAHRARGRRFRAVGGGSRVRSRPCRWACVQAVRIRSGVSAARRGRHRGSGRAVSRPGHRPGSPQAAGRRPGSPAAISGLGCVPRGTRFPAELAPLSPGASATERRAQKGRERRGSRRLGTRARRERRNPRRATRMPILERIAGSARANWRRTCWGSRSRSPTSAAGIPRDHCSTR